MSVHNLFKEKNKIKTIMKKYFLFFIIIKYNLYFVFVLFTLILK